MNDCRRSVAPAASICSSSSNTVKMRPLPRPGDDLSAQPRAERTGSSADRGAPGRCSRAPPRAAGPCRTSPARPSSGWRRSSGRSAGPAPRRTAAAAAGSGACRPSSRCGGSRRRARTAGGRRTRARGRASACSRSARFCPANARLETTCRCSSFFRKSSSNRRAMAASGVGERYSVGDVRPAALHDGVGADLVGLAFEVQEDPVAQRRQRDRRDVVDRHVRPVRG